MIPCVRRIGRSSATTCWESYLAAAILPFSKAGGMRAGHFMARKANRELTILNSPLFGLLADTPRHTGRPLANQLLLHAGLVLGVPASRRGQVSILHRTMQKPFLRTSQLGAVRGRVFPIAPPVVVVNCCGTAPWLPRSKANLVHRHARSTRVLP